MNRDQLFKAAKAQVVKYDDKSLSGSLYVKELTARELSDFADKSQSDACKGVPYVVFLLIHTVCDSKGKLILSLADKNDVLEFGAKLTGGLFDLAKKVNGLDSTTDEIEKN